jgi:hypothetical protein
MKIKRFNFDSAFGREITFLRTRLRFGFFTRELPTPAHFTTLLSYPRFRVARKVGWQLRIGVCAIAYQRRPALVNPV